MKKTFLFSLGLILAFSSLFISCSEKEPVYYNVSVNSSEGGKANFSGNYLGNSMVVDEGESITVVATPDEGCVFLGWFIGDSETAVSTEVTYTFTVNENIALIARFKEIEAIDLGLSVKWAAYNVGATKPEEYGGYYAWGETEEKSNYDWSTYKWCNGSENTMTKYCTDSSFGTVDNKTTLDPEDDVAHVKWGGDWRMPTTDEQRELLNNCDWEWTTLNGVNGYRVTGPNGNSIFLPAAGCRLDTFINFRGNFGLYWSSSLYSDYSGGAYRLNFFDGNYDRNHFGSRYDGRSVRPVSK